MNDRTITVKNKIPLGNLTFIETYAHVDGKNKGTQKYYQGLLTAYNTINKNEYIMISRDVDASIGVCQFRMCWNLWRT